MKYRLQELPEFFHYPVNFLTCLAQSAPAYLYELSGFPDIL
jgi:hypothetical protein